MDRSVGLEDEFDVRGSALALWSSFWLIFAVTLVGAAAAAIAALLFPKQYEATVLLLPVSEDSTSRLGSAIGSNSQLTNLISMVGISPSSSSMKAAAIATLQSEVLTERYIKEHKLLPVLFYNQWDQGSGLWNTTDRQRVPTLWKANVLFKQKIRRVTDDARSGTVTMSVTWRDPQLAAQWANGLVMLTNDYLKDQAIMEAERNIAYLQTEISKTNVVELRGALYSLMEEEVKGEMLARGRDEYALKVVDPAVAPERPSSPRPVLWISAGAFAGFLATAFFILLRRKWQSI